MYAVFSNLPPVGRLLIATFAAGFLAAASHAQSNPLENGWTLLPEASSLAFQSIKGGTKAESSSFAHLEGAIDPAGQAKIRVFLESVDTKIDLRNVRMRFLFFETFQFPEATITAQIDAGSLAGLLQSRREVVALPFVLQLHGAAKSYETDVVVTLLRDNEVSVASAVPIPISVADFGLSDGLNKLEEAAGLPIVPLGTVSFDFVFARNGAGGSVQVASAARSANGASVALETSGDFSLEECNNRFETFSRSSGIYFAPGSARIDPASAPLLDTLATIVKRCPGLVIEVGGHTDSIGDDASNQRLSEQRAASVAQYLAIEGIEDNRVRPKGYGEWQPVASNETAEGRQRNRRIEFTIIGG